MSKGQFRTQVREVYNVYKTLGLAQSFNDQATYPPELAGAVRKRSYRDEWEHYVRNSRYDIKLSDWSLLQFRPQSESNRDPSYCYQDCPLELLSYEDFVADVFGADAGSVGDEFWEEYEQSVYTSRLKASVTPIRYDYSPTLYAEGVHPAAHIHIGYQSEIRLFTERKLLPLSFGLFVLRQVYPKKWKDFLKFDKAAALCRHVREELEVVGVDYYQPKDKLQLVLA
jgi:hypothetical protein